MSIDWNILRKGVAGTLSEAESRELTRWLEASEKYRELYRRMNRSVSYAPSREQLARWRTGFHMALEQAVRQRKKRRAVRWGISAAAAALALWVSTTLWFTGPQDPVPAPDHPILLTMSSGEVIEWERVLADEAFDLNGRLAGKQEAALSLLAAEHEPAGEALETELPLAALYIPRGKEFQLELADGTRVWLNSDTRFEFPVSFSAAQRTVKLHGEAYFQVSQDPERVFSVEMDGMAVMVYGTEFNINSRDPQKHCTTLISGSVSVSVGGGAEILLQPGQTLQADLLRGETRLHTYDVNRHAAWRSQAYFFENQTIAEILEELTLWYDVEVEFADRAARQERFSGWLQRKETIGAMLHPIASTSYVRFEQQGRKIIVKINEKN
ncbi:MAG: FecR domain-containing protein [Rikenellaceae bacterium]|nr:FecR domain-containing protein [Rikenellaceae bacterium]